MTSDYDKEPELQAEGELGEDEVFLFPASFAQRRLWFLDELNPGNCLYNIPMPVRLRGSLDRIALEDALAEIVYRQESLRTVFAMEDGEVMQVIDPSMSVPLAAVDLTDVPEAEREARAFELVTEDARTPFDLAKGPLLRTTLLQVSGEDHILLVTMHHIISDGWSMGVFISELTALYRAFAQGEESPLQDLTLQYADYSHWQREWLQGDALAKQLGYWQQQLTGVAVLQLPTDRPRPAVQANRGALYPFALSQELTKRLHDLTQRTGTTLFMTLMAAFQTLLHRYSGQSDIAVGTPIAGRSEAEIEGLIGFFVNTLVLRSDLSADPAFRDLLAQVRENTLDAYSHQDVPFEKIVEAVQVERNMSHTPLFQVMFALQNTPAAQIELPGLTLSQVEVDLGMAKFDLNLSMADGPNGIQAVMEYNTDLFDRATIVRMMTHFEQLLQTIAADPDRKLSQIPLLTAAERTQLLEDWNPSAQNTGEAVTECLHQVFEKMAARTPDRVAVTYEENSLTYRELNERANRLAHYLQKQGVGPDRLVGICLERSLEMVVSILAVLKAGGAYVPLDPAYPEDRIAFVLEDAAAGVLLTQQSALSRLPEHGAKAICLDTDWAAIAAEPADNPDSGVTPDHLAYVIYTSGSTGKPKGVLIPHGNVIRLFTATDEWYGFNEQDVWTLFHSFAFDFSVWEIWGALLYGGKLVVVPYLTSRSPEAFYELLGQEKVTVLNQTPSAFRQLMAAEEMLGVSDSLALRYVIFGGEALELRSLKPWYDRHGDQQPQLVNMYGITETTVHVTYRALTLQDVEQAAGSVIGVPIPDLQVYVLDPHLQPVPVGVIGEMYVGGAGVARGYLNRPELTDERFIPHPFHADPNARLYKTGDLARFLPDGDLEYHGRIDHQVKIRGFRIELGEIESALSGHEGVRTAVVLVREDKPGDKKLVAYLVPHPQTELHTADLRQFVGETLPEHMIPSAFVVLDDLPLTQNGKVDTRALPAPDHSQAERSREYIAPRNETEAALVEIFQEVLGIERVGIDDGYFELGGDSILSIQVLSKARQRGLSLTLQDLFRHQAARELALQVGQSESAADAFTRSEPFSLITDADRDRLPDGVEDAYPLTHLQAGMLFHTQLHPESAVYHNINSYRLRGPFDQKAFEQAAAVLAERHEILRTSFHLLGYSEPLQLVHRDLQIPVAVHDLRHLPEDEQEQAISAFMDVEKRDHFDYAKAPLLRFYIHLRSEDTFQFGFTEHHVILDGWSVATMLSEFFEIYLTLLKGGALTAGEILPFREFVALERAALQSAETASYWHETLSGHTFTNIPRSLPEQAAEQGETHSHLIDLEPELVQALQNTAETLNVPIKSVFLAAHLRVMSLVSGQRDVLTGLVTNGRVEEEGGEKTLGLFLNTLPYRMELTGGTWADLVRGTFATEQNNTPHRRYPMAQIQQDLGGHPLFETTFNYTHFHVYENVFGNGEIEVLSESGFGITNFTYGVDFMNSVSAGVYLKVWWDSAQFTDEHMKQVIDSYVRVLEAMTADPHSRYDGQSFLSADETHRLLVEWNGTSADFPADAVLHRLFEEQAARTPDRVAVSYKESQLTYGELNRKANQLAHRLQREGVGRDIPVGLCVDRSLEMVVGLLAVLKAGGAYVPIDPSYPADRIAYILSDTDVPVLLTQQHLLSVLPSIKGRTICLDSEWASLEAESEAVLPVDVQPDDLAYLIYTSGSTGQPKGVMIPHIAICNHMFWMQETYSFSAEDRILQKTPFSFDASVWEFWAPLLIGAELVMAEPGGHQDSRYLTKAIQEHGITVLQVVPTMLQMLLQEPDFAGCVSLRHFFCGGEALSKELADRCASLLNVSLHNLYGPTETTIDATVWDYFADAPYQTIPIGRPISNVEAYILDAAMQPVPTGVPGELHIGGRGLARGYFNRPDLTAEKFVPHPFSKEQGARLYKTGDLVRYLPDGQIEYVGRIDHQVKIRGFRIELGEVESALSSHPLVDSALAVAREDQPGDVRLIGYAASESAADLTARELREFLQASLPDYMIPTAFVILPEFPLTPNGKIDRRALPVPDGSSADRDQLPVAPRNETERAVAAIWSEILRVEEVGVYDNFFELGGHSLLATQVVSRVSAALQTDVSLRMLFAAPTVAALAEEIQRMQGTASSSEATPIPVIPRDGRLPLSFAQERLWFLEQLDGGNAAYNIPLAIRLEGELDLDALQNSFAEILSRHEALRTRFVKQGGQAVQEILPAADLHLATHDLRHLLPEQREEALAMAAAEEASRPFDLTHDLLVRAALITLSGSEHVLLLTMHHIVSDGWSIGVMVEEMAALYAAHVAGASAPLQALPIQYADYANWQRDRLAGGVMEEQLAYWTRQLSGSPALLQLPTDRPRPAVQTYNGRLQSFALTSDMTDALKKLSHETGATLFMTLLAAFKTLLYRCTGQEDLLIGSPIAGRTRPEIERLIGFFVNTLVLRSRPHSSLPFAGLLEQVREASLEAYAHQDVPFEKIVERVQSERDMSYSPLFQVMFSLQNAPMGAVELPALTLSQLEIDVQTAKFDLTLNMSEGADGLQGAFEYNTDLFDDSTITRLIGHLQTLLSGIVADPQQTLSELPMLSNEEREQLLHEWNQTAVDYPADVTLHALFEAQAARTPDRIAVRHASLTLTYEELNRRANRLAHQLRELGAGPDVPVGLFFDRSLDMVTAMLAVLKAGGAYVPLDPFYPADRIAFVAEDAAMKIMLTQTHLRDRLDLPHATVICLDANGEQDSHSAENPAPVNGEEDLAYILYTSGSTGRPKGVMIPHRAICNHMFWMQETYAFAADDRVLQKTSCSFDASVWEFWAPLLAGAELVMAEPGGHQDSRYLTKAIQEHGITVLQVVPTMLQMLLQEPGFAACHSLRHLFCGGEALSKEAADRCVSLLDVQVHNLYGPTEATIDATVWDYQADAPYRTIPIGRPISNVEAYILDAAMQPVPTGVPGELHIGGRGLARGYLNRADLTAEKFVPHPFADGEQARLYKTGDLARYLPDGMIEYLGRIDHQVKVRGFRIELGEIESLLALHPAVKETVVLVREDAPGNQQIVAYLVPSPTEAPSQDELRQILQADLPDYMIPSAFILLEAMPLTPNGKLDRNALPAPDLAAQNRNEFVAPRDEIEWALAQIWEEELGTAPIGVKHNFFALGGNSLLAVRLIARIEQQFQRTLPLASLFQAGTIEYLASLLREEGDIGDASPLVEIQKGTVGQPLFLVHPVGGSAFTYTALAQELPDRPVYGLQSIGLRQDDAPEQSVEEMAASYVNAIRSVQAAGPYSLGGWSLGGTVAFEMAKQLKEQGEEIALLALIDTQAPIPELKEHDLPESVLINGFVHDFVAGIGLQLDNLLEQIEEQDLSADEVLRLLLGMARAQQLVPPDAGEKQLKRLYNVYVTNMRAYHRYEPKALNQSAHLFRAADDEQYALRPANGWDQLIAGDLQILPVPGRHLTLVQQPHVQQLAAQMQELLNATTALPAK